MQLDYDPTQISYAELLEVFWTSHSPSSRPWSRQYMSVIFYHNEEQKRLAMETKDREAARTNSPIFTEIVPFTEFYLAEDYHQKHRLRQVPDLMKDFEAIYRDPKDFVDSTAAARVNGYLGGHGTLEGLQVELNDLGLSPTGSKKLLDIVSGRSRLERTCN